MHALTRRPRRAAYTLIEMLVVILIIGILAGLLVTGVVVYMNRIPEMTTRHDILQLNAALQQFKTKYGVYPPSKIKLCSTLGDYNLSNSFDAESVTYIQRIWPKIAWASQAIPWADTTLPKGGVILDGDQCLVFFLGGIPEQSTPACKGFSVSVTNPAVFNANLNSGKISFFEFNSERLYERNPTGGVKFYSYRDGYKRSDPNLWKPIVYFSSGFGPNGYNSRNQFSHALAIGGSTVAPFCKTQDAQGFPKDYHQPSTYQLVSAGLDGMFCPPNIVPPSGTANKTIYGTRWTAEQATTATAEEGRDDLTNFASGLLGSKQ